MNDIENIRISIIIVTYNRPDDLTVSLPTIFAQTYPIHEIIIVDDSSDDKTKQACEQLRLNFPSLLWHRNTRTHSIPDARNEGITLANGDIICFFDDDITLQNDYLENIIKVFETHQEALGVTGYDLNLKPPPKVINALLRIMAKSHFRKDIASILPSIKIIFPFPLTKIITCERLIGHNMAYRREVFSKFCFSPAPADHFAIHDDIEFSYLLQKKFPGTLFVTPYAKLRHRYSPLSRNTTLKIVRNHQWHEWKFFKNLLDKTPYNVLYFYYSRIYYFINYPILLVKQHTSKPEKPILESLLKVFH